MRFERRGLSTGKAITLVYLRAIMTAIFPFYISMGEGKDPEVRPRVAKIARPTVLSLPVDLAP